MDRRSKPYYYLSQADVEHDDMNNQEERTEEDLARFLIGILCQTNGKQTLENIIEKKYRSLANFGIVTVDRLREFVKKYSRSFCISDIDSEISDSDSRCEVEVTTAVTVCPLHVRRYGSCPDDAECGSLHVCKFYMLTGKCEFNNHTCHYGHKLRTDHNNSILKRHLLDHLPTVDLRMLLKRQKVRTQCTRPKICHFYNNFGCSKGVNCGALHICKRFVLDRCTFGDSCKRSHDLLDPTVIFILNQYAVDLVDLSALLWDNEKAHAVVRNDSQKNKKPDRGGSGQKSFPTLFSKRRGYTTGELDSKVIEDHNTNTGEISPGAVLTNPLGYKTLQTSEVYSKPYSSVSKSYADVFPFSVSSVNLPSKAQILSKTLTLEASASSRQAVTVSSQNQDEHTHSSQETHLSFATSIGQNVLSIGQNLSRPVASVPPQIYKRADQCSETKTGRITGQSPRKGVPENVECVKNTVVQQKLPHDSLSRTETTEQPGTSSGFADAKESLKSIISNLISDMQKLHSINAEMSGPESHFVSYLSALAEPVKLEEELQAAHNECLEKGIPAQPEVFKSSPNRARHLSEGEITDSESDIGEDQKKVSGLSPIVISSTSTLPPAVNSSSTFLETKVFSKSFLKEKVFVDYHHSMINSPSTAISNTMPRIPSAGYKTEKDPVESIKTCIPNVHILSNQSAIFSSSERKHVRQEPLKKTENLTSSGKILGDELECIESPENSLSDISVESCTNFGVRKSSTDVTSGQMVDASDVQRSNLASTGRPRTFIYLNPDKFAVVNYSHVVGGRHTDTRACGQSWNKHVANASASCSDLERGQTFEHHMRLRQSPSDTVIKQQNINSANDISLEEISSGDETLKQGHTFSSNLPYNFVGPSNQGSQKKCSHNRNNITKPLKMQPLPRAPETFGFRCHPGEAISFEQDTPTLRAGKSHKMINTDDQHIGLVDEVEVFQGFKTFSSHLQRREKRRGSSPKGRTSDHCLRKSPVDKAQSSHKQPGDANRKNCSPERKRSCLQKFSGGVSRAREKIPTSDIIHRTDERARCRLSEHSESPNKDDKFGCNNTKYLDEPVQSKPEEFLSRSYKDDHSSSGERSHNEFRPSSSGEQSSKPDACLNNTHFKLSKFFRQEQRSGEISQRSVEFFSRHDEKQVFPARSFRSIKFSKAKPKQSSRQDARSGECSPRSGDRSSRSKDRSSRHDDRRGSDDKKVRSNKYYRFKAEHSSQQKERSRHEDDNSHIINELSRESGRGDDSVVHNRPDGRQSERPFKQLKNQTYKQSHLSWEANGQHTFKRLSRDRDRQRSGSPQRLFSHKPDSSSSGQAETRQDFPVQGLSPLSREQNQSPYLHSRQMLEDVRERDRDLKSKSQDRLLPKSKLDQISVFKGNLRDSSRRRYYQKHNHAFEQQQQDDNIHKSFIEQDVEDYDWEEKEGFSRRNSIRNRLGPSPDRTEVVVEHTLIREDFALTPFEDSKLQKSPLEITEHNHYGRFSNYQEWEKMDKLRQQKEVGLSEREIVLKYSSSQSQDKASHTRPVDSYIQREREIEGERFSPQREFSREDNVSLGRERPFGSSTGPKVERKVSREKDFSERGRKRQNSPIGIMCYKSNDRLTSFADSVDVDKAHGPVKKFKLSHSVFSFKKDIEEKHYRKNNYNSWASTRYNVDRLDNSSELESDQTQEDQWLGEHQEAFVDRRERTFDAREKLSNRRVQQPARGRRPVRERLGQRRDYEDLAERQLMVSDGGEEPQHPYSDYGKEDGEEEGLEDETETGDDMCVNETPGGHNTNMDEAEDDLEQGEPTFLTGTRGRSRGFRGPIKFSYFRGRGRGSWRARGRGHLKPDLRSLLINRNRSKILSTAKTEGLQIRLKRKTPTPERQQESRYEDSSGREVVMNVQDY